MYHSASVIFYLDADKRMGQVNSHVQRRFMLDVASSNYPVFKGPATL